MLLPLPLRQGKCLHLQLQVALTLPLLLPLLLLLLVILPLCLLLPRRVAVLLQSGVLILQDDVARPLLLLLLLLLLLSLLLPLLALLALLLLREGLPLRPQLQPLQRGRRR